MIQDIAPHIYHNEYKPVPPDKDSYILAYTKGQIFMKQDSQNTDITFPCFRELEGKITDLYEHYIYLFRNEHAYGLKNWLQYRILFPHKKYVQKLDQRN